MHLLAKNMDSAATDWHPYRRRYPSPLPLARIDLIRAKDYWIRATFGTCNFSLILRGQGEFWRHGQLWDVHAPCVIAQWPGERLEYGPSGPGATWDELYLMYGGELFNRLRAQNLLDPDRPVWRIDHVIGVQALLDALFALLASAPPDQVVDRIDRLCEQLILETHLPPPEPMDGADEALLIRRIERELVSNLDCDIDLDDLAARNGMSLRTFRRRWGQIMALPPVRHRQQARLRQASRFLIHTTWPIYEIARKVGFQDELYFSRRFHQEYKISPRAYRRQFQLRPSASNSGAVNAADLIHPSAAPH